MVFFKPFGVSTDSCEKRVCSPNWVREANTLEGFLGTGSGRGKGSEQNSYSQPFTINLNKRGSS